MTFGALAIKNRCIVKRWIMIASLLLSVAALQGSAKSAPESQSRVQDTQARGFWIDPSTSLIWAAKDNGKDVTWKQAMKYCRELRLAGHSDWRLASIGELKGIYDKDANAAGLMGPSGKGTPATWHVKGDLFLTGNQWSRTQLMDDRGHPSGWASRFDFNEGRVFNGDEITFYTNKRALCARGSQK
jgi:hypothetical protein